MEKLKNMPSIGMRIIKSTVAVFICYLISFLRGDSGIVFYSQIAALWCIQMYVQDTWKNARQRLTGTVVGAVYGLIFLLTEKTLWNPMEKNGAFYALLVSLTVGAVLYTTVLMKQKQASYFSCVVFLSIAVNHIGDGNPYLFVWNRFLDTVIGIIVGLAVNQFSLPKGKREDILFISGVDGILLNQQGGLSDYCKVEMNRLIDKGVKFTIATMRTPASLLEPLRDVRLNLPVIVMDGAALYHIAEKEYRKVYVISSSKSREVANLIKEAGLKCFTNIIVDDVLFIYYEEPEDEVQKLLVRELRKSPYRNFINRAAPETEQVVYFMMLYPKQVINEFYQILESNGITKDLKVLKFDSDDYPGYAYIKIYNRNATRENMIAQLQQMIGMERKVMFGTNPGHCDILVDEGDFSHMLRQMKKMYEPIKWIVFPNKK